MDQFSLERGSQFQLERWWIELYRSNGLAASTRLRKSGRASSDTALRSMLNKATFKTFKKAQRELLIERSGNYSRNVLMIMRLLESIEGLALTHLIISAALNHLLGTSNDSTMAAVGGSLVKAVETELRIRFIEKVQPELLKGWRKSKGTFTHRNKALLVKAGTADLPDFFASHDVKSDLGMALASMLLLCPMFEPYLAKRGKGSIWCIRVSDTVRDTFNRSSSFDTFLSTVPPLGLYTEPQDATRESDPYLLKRRPILTAHWLRGQHHAPAKVPDVVVSSIEHLNKVGYRVNERMLDWVLANEARLAALGVLPQLEFKVTQADRAERSRMRTLYNNWYQGEPKRRAYFRLKLLAGKLRGQVFYHDWFVDFRGRMYTTSNLLSPQGTPINKALVQFSKEVSIEYGTLGFHEFWDYGKRLVFGKNMPELPDMKPLIQAALAGTLDPNQLNDTKDYLPFVAWSLDADRLIRGERYVKSGIMLRRDATASSIQHMATMAKDRVLMKRVNLVPHEPVGVSDLYAGIGVGVALSRSGLKSFIVTYAYNSTAYGRALERQAQGEDRRLKELIAEDKLIEASLRETLAGVAGVRDFLTELGRASSWKFTSPSGMVFDGARYEYPNRKVWVRFNNARIQVRLRTTSGEPDVNAAKSESAFVANVIHSFDAAMLHMCKKPDSVAFIHDCIVTLPGFMEQACKDLRASFFKMHAKLNEEFDNWGVAENVCLEYDKYMVSSKYMFI